MYLYKKNEMGTGSPTEVAYWRKANQIHQWFVKECQDGVDECQETEVSAEKIKVLYDLCRQALVDRNPGLLPPTQGFFFGGTEVDEWYWHNVLDTCIYLAPHVWEASKGGGSRFTYQSSW